MEALGQSEPFLQFQEKLSKVAGVNRPVLFIGERGTGKELAASRIHYLSKRWDKPFVTLNCAALSPTLIEAELFGYEKGAFTGAQRRRRGRFEEADGGTLFLDEIGNIPMETQEKILRVVEYGSFERVGSVEPIDVDVRIVGATNADLPVLAKKGRFKRDLLDRLSFEVLFLPPLRVRGEDVMLLACHFAARMAFELGLEAAPEFSLNAITEITNYSWPGNIRELKNVVERAVYKTGEEVIDEIIFDPFVSPYAPVNTEITEEPESSSPDDEATRLSSLGMDLNFKEIIETKEVELLKRGLRENRYNQKKSAAALGLSYDQLRGLIRKYGSKRLGLS